MQERDTFQLVMGRGPRPGQVFELPRRTISIGRDPGNHVVINDPQISRQHARITPQGGLLILEDLNSTNGTTVNGFRITGVHTLAHGDEIGLGDNITLIFYGRPASDGGETQVAPRSAYAGPSPTRPSYDYQPAPPATLEKVSFPDYQSLDQDYAPATAADYADYPEYYEEYPEETGRSWTLMVLGCILTAIIIVLLIAIFIYFFAPASIVDPIADFLAGFGLNVP